MPIRGIPFEIVRLKISRNPASALKRLARDERYRIFAKLEADYVVLAQHLDDQAETLMLQLLRGAGVKGLRGMPVVRDWTFRDQSPLQKAASRLRAEVASPEDFTAITGRIPAGDRGICAGNAIAVDQR